MEITEKESKMLEIESLYNEALSDPSFSFGHRLKGKVTPEVRKVIAELYREIKAKRKLEN